VEPPRRDHQIVRARLHAYPDPRDRRRHRSAAPRREARPHPQHPAREPRAALGAPRHRPARTHPLAAAPRDRRPRRRGPAPRHRGPRHPRQARPHALEGRRYRPAVLRLGQRAAAPRLIAGRRAGPVFLSSLHPSPARAPAVGDICPLTGAWSSHTRLARDGRRRPAFVVVRASRRRFHGPCSARNPRLRCRCCFPIREEQRCDAP
jgi:hypothetical protein